MTLKYFNFGLSIFVITLLSISLIKLETVSAAFPKQTLRYSINHVGKNVGELEVIFSDLDNLFTVTTIIHLSLFAQMFLTEQTSKIFFEKKNGELLLLHGKYFHKKNNELIHSFEINRSKHVIQFLTEDQVIFYPGTIFESDNFPIYLINSPIDNLEGKKVMTVSGKRARWYQYMKPKQDKISSNGRLLDMLKVSRFQIDDPNRSVTTFWLDPKSNYMPAKIIIVKNGKKTVISLLTF